MRWGPHGLLALTAFLTFAAGPVFMTRPQMYGAGALLTAAAALQVWWSMKPMPPPGAHPARGRVYFVVRSALGFALTWLSPFSGVYAVLGYFDAGRLLPGRQAWAGLAFTAVVMAGSNVGGLPPEGYLGWTAFAGLFVLHGGLVCVFARIEVQQAEQTEARINTIAELERTNARLEQALEENAGLQAQLLVQAREAGVADERSRLAAEIHDTLAQGLTGIVTQLNAAADSADPAVARQHVQRAAALARQSLGEARRSVQDLGPGALETAALPEALRATVEAWSSASSVRGEFAVTGPAEPLHEELEATLLRVAQEALANVQRHARAFRAVVTLSYMDDEVSVDVRDDGCGFTLGGTRGPGSVGRAQGDGASGAAEEQGGDPPAGPRSRGFGLVGMRARAERVAGSFEIESEPGQGTAVSVRVPLVRRAGARDG